MRLGANIRIASISPVARLQRWLRHLAQRASVAGLGIYAPTGEYEAGGDSDRGLGKSFMDGAANVGIAYYAQWKVSDDDFGLRN